MELFKKHVDTVTILTAFAIAILWMNGKFNQVDKQFSDVNQELAVIKTVLIMKQIMPAELASNNLEK